MKSYSTIKAFVVRLALSTGFVGSAILLPANLAFADRFTDQAAYQLIQAARAAGYA
jgi:hypothetical protein